MSARRYTAHAATLCKVGSNTEVPHSLTPVHLKQHCDMDLLYWMTDNLLSDQ